MKTASLVILLAILFFPVRAQYYNISMGLNLASQDRSVYPYPTENMHLMPAFNAQFGYDFHVWQFIYYSVQIGYDQVGIMYSSPQYNESFSYVQLINAIKVRAPFTPVYFSAGAYAGVLATASVNDAGDLSSLSREDYRFYDNGLLPALGLAYERDFFLFFVELKYKTGLINIYKNANEYIKNRAFVISVGAGFIIP